MSVSIHSACVLILSLVCGTLKYGGRVRYISLRNLSLISSFSHARVRLLIEGGFY